MYMLYKVYTINIICKINITSSFLIKGIIGLESRKMTAVRYQVQWKFLSDSGLTGGIVEKVRSTVAKVCVTAFFSTNKRDQTKQI